MDNVFFGESGLTSTSANHVANLAKEFVQHIENELKTIKFIDTSVSLIGSNEKNILSEGACNEQILIIQDMLHSISQANSLIAWLREAIKAREEMLREVNGLTIEEWADMIGVTLPVQPTRKKVRTKEECIANRNIKERNKIYSLQAKAAVIGKYIHPDGKFAEARAELMEKLHDKHKISGNGRDTLLYHYQPSCSWEVIEKVFSQLQAEHREIQAELNGIYHVIEEEIREEQAKTMKEYKSANVEYNAKYQECYTEYQKHIEEEGARRAALKIIIPNELQEIYKRVNQLGK